MALAGFDQNGVYYPSYLVTKSGCVPVDFGLHGVEQEDVVDKNKKKVTYQHFLVGNIPLSVGDSQTPVKFQR